MHHNDYKSALVDFFRELSPYAHVTIAPNYPTTRFSSRAGATASLKRVMRETALVLDHRYFGKRRLIRDIVPSDRFDAICWPEKLEGNPHIHCAFFLNAARAEELDAVSKRKEEQRRLAFLLTSLRTSDTPLLDADRLLLSKSSLSVDAQVHRRLSKIAPGGSCCVTSVSDAKGLARYTSKEYNKGRGEEGSDFFFLSDFHSPNSARKLLVKPKL